MKTAVYALLGTALIVVAIPFGLMLAPLIVGAVLLAFGIRRADRSFQVPFPVVGEPA